MGTNVSALCSDDGVTYLFFFFKQKTAYEMRISDWSSDVCSSDLLIADGPPPMLTRLKTLLETLRVLAGEAHERKQAPAVTWAARGKGARVGNSVRLVSLSAKAAGESRLAQRKADIERLAEEAGIVAQFHLRVNAKR